MGGTSPGPPGGPALPLGCGLCSSGDRGAGQGVPAGMSQLGGRDTPLHQWVEGTPGRWWGAGPSSERTPGPGLTWQAVPQGRPAMAGGGRGDQQQQR